MEPLPAGPRLLGRLPAGSLSRLAAASQPLTRHLDAWMELVGDDAGKLVGFVTSGDGADFTERATRALEAIGIDPVGIGAHRRLAAAAAHRRGLVKIEWTADGGARAARYHRRRPPVGRVLARLAEEEGVRPEVLRRVAGIADLVGKRTVHFTSLALVPGRPPVHRLYFTWYLRGATRRDAPTRLAALASVLGSAAPDPARHAACAGPPGGTLWLSIRLDAHRVHPELKVDYGAVPLEPALAWLPEHRRPRARQAAQELLAAAGRPRLDHLGVRFDRGPEPDLKFYVRASQPGAGR